MINPNLDFQDLAKKYDKKKRIEIPHFFQETTAEAIYQSLENLRINDGWFQALHYPPVDSNTKDFAYKFQSFPLRNIKYNDPDRWRPPSGLAFKKGRLIKPTSTLKKNDPLLSISEMMNSKRTHSLISFITGTNLASFSASIYASMYLSGDFITPHNDDAPHKTVIGVLNLSKNWKSNWGGVLAIYEKNKKRIIERYTPSFNTLILFDVPLLHAVLPVTQSCKIPRYAISAVYRAPH